MCGGVWRLASDGSGLRTGVGGSEIRGRSKNFSGASASHSTAAVCKRPNPLHQYRRKHKNSARLYRTLSSRTSPQRNGAGVRPTYVFEVKHTIEEWSAPSAHLMRLSLFTSHFPSSFAVIEAGLFVDSFSTRIKPLALVASFYHGSSQFTCSHLPSGSGGNAASGSSDPRTSDRRRTFCRSATLRKVPANQEKRENR